MAQNVVPGSSDCEGNALFVECLQHVTARFWPESLPSQEWTVEPSGSSQHEWFSGVFWGMVCIGILAARIIDISAISWKLFCLFLIYFSGSFGKCRYPKTIDWLVVWNMFFPYIGNSNPNWLIFFGGVETTNQLILPLRDTFWMIWMLWQGPHKRGSSRVQDGPVG